MASETSTSQELEPLSPEEIHKAIKPKARAKPQPSGDPTLATKVLVDRAINRTRGMANAPVKEEAPTPPLQLKEPSPAATQAITKASFDFHSLMWDYILPAAVSVGLFMAGAYAWKILRRFLFDSPSAVVAQQSAVINTMAEAATTTVPKVASKATKAVSISKNLAKLIADN